MYIHSNNPIGIFDSGVGGTSIWKEIHSLLPNEQTIYLADSKNAAYGDKSTKAIVELSVKNTEFLLKKQCKLIVVACNTATTNAISYLRETYPVPFIGIEPAIKPAALKTRTNVIGILATKGTLNSGLFEQTAATLPDTITVVEQIGEGLVELIEEGQIDSTAMDQLLRKHLNPIMAHQADCLVLGCTHYPYLISKIREIVGTHMQIIDSGEAVARQTKKILSTHQLLNTSETPFKNEFFTNGNKSVLTTLLKNYPNTLIQELSF